MSELARRAAAFRDVLPPRLGGPLALMERGLDVVFLDHSGFEGSAVFGAFWSGNLIGKTIAVRLWRVPFDEIPTTGCDRWLFEQWRETDAWVEAHA